MRIDMSKLEAAAEEAQSSMCCMEHPIYRVLCLRNIGHKGQHWFMVRWEGAREATAEVLEVIKQFEATA